MYYYLEKENKIILFDTDRETLENTLLCLNGFTSEDIKETDKVIVMFNNENRFLEDIENEYLEQKKQDKIEELDNFLMDKIRENVKKQYNIDIDFNKQLTLSCVFKIARQLNKTIQELVAILQQFYSNIKTIQDAMEDMINNKKSIETLDKIDFEKEYNKLK